MDQIEKLYKEWESLQPVSEEVQAKVDQKFMLEFNYNSNHIEGNTLTYGQTELLLIFGKVDGDAKMHDLEEMKAHNVGLKMMQEEASSERPLTEYFIKSLHRTLIREDYNVQKEINGQIVTYTVHAGQYKTRPNSVKTVTGEIFEYALPEETSALMTDLIDWYNSAVEEGKLSGLELASLFHYRYIRIHPFEDGNGRIARLLVNFILLRAGYPMIIVRSNDKDKYLSALNRCDVTVGLTPSDGAHAELAQIRPFVEYMDSCLERALTLRIKAAKGDDIEEEDDWQKELKVKFAPKLNLPEKTKDGVSRVMAHVFLPLIRQVNDNLKSYYSIFYSVIWTPGVGKYTQFNDIDGNVVDDIYYSSIHFTYINSVGNKVECPIFICVEFKQFGYEIAVYTVHYQFRRVPIFCEEYTYTTKDTMGVDSSKGVTNSIGKHITAFLRNASKI